MNSFIFVMCVLHPAGYCADLIEERYATQQQCQQVVEQYRRDKRVLVYCRPEGAQEIRRENRGKQ